MTFTYTIAVAILLVIGFVAVAAGVRFDMHRMVENEGELVVLVGAALILLPIALIVDLVAWRRRRAEDGRR